MKEIALPILDIIHNSIRAKASEVSLNIAENPAQNDYILTISDNGKDIPADMLTQVTDPFTTSRKTRKVGMKLALLRQNAEQSGGNIEISSTPTSGTTVKCRFGFHHLDLLPAGDIPGVLIQLKHSLQFAFWTIRLRQDHLSLTPAKSGKRLEKSP